MTYGPARKNDSDTTKYFLTGPDFFMTSSYIVPGPALSLCQKLNSSSFYSRKQWHFFFQLLYYLTVFLDLKNCKEIGNNDLQRRKRNSAQITVQDVRHEINNQFNRACNATKKFAWKDLQALPVLTGILDTKESQDLQGSLAHEDLWV